MNMIKSLARRALHQAGYTLVRYRTSQGGFGQDAAASTAATTVYDPDMEPEFRELHAACAAYSMTPVGRMYALYQCMQHVLARNVPGDIVECGVWRGGSAMLCAMMLHRAGDRSRKVYLYDTFAGMVEPTDKDVGADGMTTKEIWQASQKGASNDWCFASLDDVRANMARTGLDASRFVYVQGKVEETLPITRPDRIALLRLDTDWYESTKQELTHLYPLLSVGGVLLVDDYGQWLGQREAVDAYIKQHALGILLHRVDNSSRVGIKRAEGTGGG